MLTLSYLRQLSSLAISAFRLLDQRERRWSLLMLGALSVAGLVDMLALASVMPVVAVIVEPRLIYQHKTLVFIKHFFPDLTTNQFVFFVASIAAMLLTISSCLTLVMNWANNRFGVSIQTRQAHRFMLLAMGAPYVWFLGQNSASLVRFFYNDITRWGRDFIQRLISMVQYIVSIVLPLGVVIAIAPQAGIISLSIVIFFGFVLTSIIQPKIKTSSVASKKATDRLVVIANHALSGVKDIKVACQEEQFARNFANAFYYSSRATASLMTWQMIPGTVLMLFGQLALLGLAITLWSSGLSSGQIAGQMAIVVLVVSRIIPAANRFFGLFSVIAGNIPFVREVIRIEKELVELNSKDKIFEMEIVPEKWGRLFLQNITFTYPGKLNPALNEVTFEIQSGKSYGVVGMSGAGKSTLVDIIIGLYRVSGGEIRLDGADFYSFDMKSWQKQIGYVPQSPYITDDTLKSNVALGVEGNQIDEGIVRNCLKLANLEDFVSTLPEGINTPLGDRGILMSGGQRQRLAIARALYQNPHLIVLDEATSSLDNISEREVQQTVIGLRGKVTMLIIAHRIASVRDCDEILFLEGGRLIGHGTFDSLLANSSSFRELVSGTL